MQLERAKELLGTANDRLPRVRLVFSPESPVAESALAGVDTLVVDVDPEVLLNVNTPDDL